MSGHPLFCLKVKEEINGNAGGDLNFAFFGEIFLMIKMRQYLFSHEEEGAVGKGAVSEIHGTELEVEIICEVAIDFAASVGGKELPDPHALEGGLGNGGGFGNIKDIGHGPGKRFL
jgi:hypothetical protein